MTPEQDPPDGGHDPHHHHGLDGEPDHPYDEIEEGEGHDHGDDATGDHQGHVECPQSRTLHVLCLA